jgi:hypothetical protein
MEEDTQREKKRIEPLLCWCVVLFTEHCEEM